MESGVQPTLHTSCHHQLVFAEFDLSIYYPPPCKIQYGTTTDRWAIDLFDCDKALRINDMDKQVAIFSGTLMNIMQNLSYVMTKTPRE